MIRPLATSHLSATELQLVRALHHLWFGHVENLQIRNGEVVLDPWPTIVRDVKFGSDGPVTTELAETFELKRQVAELFEYVRAVSDGEIRCLEVRHGLPFSMEIEHRPDGRGGSHD